MVETKIIKRSLLKIFCAVAGLAIGHNSLAQDNEQTHPLVPLFEESCATCHGPTTQTAGINFSALMQETPLVKNLETWRRVIGA